MGERAGVIVYSVKDKKAYCIARSLTGVVTVFINSNEFASQSRAVRSPGFSIIGSDLPVSVTGIPAVFGKFLNCHDSACYKDLSEGLHFSCQDMIQVIEGNYRVLPSASGIYNFSRK